MAMAKLVTLGFFSIVSDVFINAVAIHWPETKVTDRHGIIARQKKKKFEHK